jgi:hypothetical protein
MADRRGREPVERGPVAEAGAWVAAVTREGQELRFTRRRHPASLLP